jgi:hypothetical protein
MTAGYIEPVVPGTSISDLSPEEYIEPAVGGWYQTFNAVDVPSKDLGWMQAQGWVVTDTTVKGVADGFVVPTTFYNMTRQVLLNWNVINDLVSDFERAYNEGREHADLRYQDVCTIWNELIVKVQTDANEEITQANNWCTFYLANIDYLVSAVEAEIALSSNAVTSAGATIETALTEFAAKLSDLENNYAGHLVDIEALLTAQTAYLNAYIGDYDALLATLESEFDTHLAAVEDLETTGSADLTTHIAAYEAVLDQLSADYDTYAATVGSLVTSASASLVTFENQITALLALIVADYDALHSQVDSLLATADSTLGTHATDHDAILALMLADYETHDTTSRAYLTDLGVTELARINEQFDNLLASTRQDLTSRGFYSSALVAQTDARIERERSEAITTLNDRLAREKAENDHKLYEQKAGVRRAFLEGESRLHGIRQEVIRYHVEAITRTYSNALAARERTIAARQTVYNARQQLYEYRAQIAVNLNQRAEALRTRTLEGKDRVYQLRDALLKFKADNDYKLAGELTAIRAQAIESTNRQHAAEQEVSRHETESRHKLHAELQGAVERVLEGEKAYIAAQTAQGEFLAQARYRLCAQWLEATALRERASKTAQEDYEHVFRYFMDERNKLMIGLFGFMERRDDRYPSLDALTQLVSGLGDAGGTQWLAP